MSSFVKPISYYLTNSFVCNLEYKDTFKNIEDIYVIGDIHGDFDVLKTILKKAKLINNSLKWIGGKSHLVQLGDLLDGKIRSNNPINNDSISAMEEFTIFEFLNDLDKQARKYGGRIHYLLGNHEIMNILGDFRYVLDKHMSSTGINIRKTLFRPGGYMANLLACHAYGVLKINNWIFCHGGLLPKHVSKHSITWINRLVKDVLNGKKKIENLTREEEEYLGGNDSFFWNRFYKNNENRCEVLNKTLDLVKIKNGGMVLGHTPHNNITNYCRKQLYFADIGLSRAFGNEFNKKQILHIKLGHKPVIII
jgi:hypothetical protein